MAQIQWNSVVDICLSRIHSPFFWQWSWSFLPNFSAYLALESGPCDLVLNQAAHYIPLAIVIDSVVGTANLRIFSGNGEMKTLLFSSDRQARVELKQPSCNHEGKEALWKLKTVRDHCKPWAVGWDGIWTSLENRYDYLRYPVIFKNFSNWKEP